jgi:hypothetical protein
MPAGGHIGTGAKGADAELRALADIFKMPDLNSAERGRGAKKVNLPPAPAPNGGNVHTFAGGFTAAIDPARGAQCVPTANKFAVKVKAAPGTALPPSDRWGKPTPAFEASHKGTP